MIIDADIPYNKNSLKKKFYLLKLFSVQNACQSFSGVDACHTSLRCETDSTIFCFLKTRLAMNIDSFLQSSHKSSYLRIKMHNTFKQLSLPFINLEAPYVYTSGNCDWVFRKSYNARYKSRNVQTTLAIRPWFSLQDFGLFMLQKLHNLSESVQGLHVVLIFEPLQLHIRKLFVFVRNRARS